MASTLLLVMVMLYHHLLLILLLSSPPTIVPENARPRVSTATRLRGDQHWVSPAATDHVAFKPQGQRGQHGFRSGDVNSCLPKGFRRTSAPSRYIHDEPFGSTMCSSGNQGTPP
ncbi:hypothetical protein NMG60_11020350 [Bertholletia excelsa]